MRDIFSEGLFYLDLLEVYGSSHVVGEICGIAQSNVYRGAQSCARLLNLGLSKEGGHYRIERNHDVQRDLRQVAQRLRSREGGLLRLVGEPWIPEAATSADRGLFQVLPKRWIALERSLDFLAVGVLDLLICRFQDLRGVLPISAEPLPLMRPLSSGELGLFALNLEPIRLYVCESHPLLALPTVTQADWAQYPSPALSPRQAPGLAQCFQPLGLWSRRLNLRYLPEGAWEEQALVDNQVIPSTARAVALAMARNPALKLRPLAYDTGLHDQDVLVVPMLLVKEPLLQQAVRHILSAYASSHHLRHASA